ncbi:uncharacterized protein N7459_000991 [Penicillium hispanicum]|uniref:uncharacterized protein n=1 Tax=Penicillium hispanicum TaxID=1080232 RepID=UPI002540B2B0|nr:uncharacterized protein N7459_000991 [Penicillium hispanicum]KAJ5594783.1 hypothetical protein N7459_000991 [Penicillium hispanicum]
MMAIEPIDMAAVKAGLLIGSLMVTPFALDRRATGHAWRENLLEREASSGNAAVPSRSVWPCAPVGAHLCFKTSGSGSGSLEEERRQLRSCLGRGLRLLMRQTSFAVQDSARATGRPLLCDGSLRSIASRKEKLER